MGPNVSAAVRAADGVATTCLPGTTAASAPLLVLVLLEVLVLVLLLLLLLTPHTVGCADAAVWDYEPEALVNASCTPRITVRLLLLLLLLPPPPRAC